MRRSCRPVVVMLLLVAWWTPTPPGHGVVAQPGREPAGAAAAWAALARALGHDPDAIGPDPAMTRLVAGPTTSTPLRDLLAARPLEAADVMDGIAADLATASWSSSRDLLHRLSELAGAPTRRGLGRSPLEALDTQRAAGRVPSPADYFADWWEVEGVAAGATREERRALLAERDATLARLRGDARGGSAAAPPLRLPTALWEVTWYLCEAARQADVLRAEAFRGLTPDELDDLRAMVLDACVGRSPERPDPALPLRFAALASRVERSILFASGVDLAIAVDAARAELRVLARAAVERPDLQPAETWLATPLGWIRLAARPSNDRIDLPRGGLPLFLSIDLGGADQYDVREIAPAWAPITIVLDAGADDDVYRGHHAATVGGLAIAHDAGGADRHEGSFAQAAAAFGVALLIDEGPGRDTFEGAQRAQGVALFGLAALVNRGEDDDAYRLISMGQGLGEPGGAAALADLGGDDAYLLGATQPYFPSALRPDRNASLGQGMGLGYRTDHAIGGALAGGVGLLVDTAGDDSYEAEVQAQGAGYWFGVGGLVDRSGRDRYRALASSIGVASQFGVGIVVDGGGEDVWSVAEDEGIAVAEEWALGVVVDRGGDDRWSVPGAGLAVARANGVALFADVAGDDTYRCGGADVFGVVEAAAPGTMRAVRPTTALAIDRAGRNTLAGEEAGRVRARVRGRAAGEGAGVSTSAAPGDPAAIGGAVIVLVDEAAR